MLGPRQKTWIEALRSGNYKQNTAYLRTVNGFCCLGVLTDICPLKEEWKPSNIAGIYFNGYYNDDYGTEAISSPRKNILDYYNLHKNWPHLAAMNDEGKTFAEIADEIEKNPALYFTAPI